MVFIICLIWLGLVVWQGWLLVRTYWFEEEALERKKLWFRFRLAVLSVPFGFAMYVYAMHKLRPPPTHFRDRPEILKLESEIREQKTKTEFIRDSE